MRHLIVMSYNEMWFYDGTCDVMDTKMLQNNLSCSKLLIRKLFCCVCVCLSLVLVHLSCVQEVVCSLLGHQL